MFDLVFAAYAGPKAPPKVVFFQFSSPDKGLVIHGSQPGRPLRDRGLQYAATRKFLMDEPLPVGVTSTGLLKLIREGRYTNPKDIHGADMDSWLYIYMTRDTKYSESWVEGNCLVLGPDQVRAFLGPFHSIYKACIRALEKKT